MNASLRGFGALAICAGGFALFSGTAQVFPEYSPTPDADPATRHEIEVSMPTRLSVQRTSTRLAISYDLASVGAVKIMIGKKMSIGIRDELRVYVTGDPRPVHASRVNLGSMSEMESAVPFLKGTEILNSVPDGIPAPGTSYVIERDISLFETDIPPQHMWSPQKSRNFKILWGKKLETNL